MAMAESLPPDASTASTGLGIRYIGDWVYAYSGVVRANGVDTTALDFTTGSGLIVASFYPTANSDQFGANFITVNIKLNGEIIIIFKERRDLGQQIDLPFAVVIPPLTHVEFIFPNNLVAGDLTAVMTGRVYGAA